MPDITSVFNDKFIFSAPSKTQRVCVGKEEKRDVYDFMRLSAGSSGIRHFNEKKRVKS
jgi:hypothetical protein